MSGRDGGSPGPSQRFPIPMRGNEQTALQAVSSRGEGFRSP